jgi:lipoprotein-anchoring transpeptidase ErfK/SrfK
MATALSMREEKRQASLPGWVVAVSLLLLAACKVAPPPGAEANATASAVTVVVVAGGAVPSDVQRSAAGAPGAAGRSASADSSGNLPFEPTGEKLVSVAWRAWIYTDPGPNRTRFGYLRAGAVVDRWGAPIVNDGCADGWYRVNPRGYMCIGKGATLDLDHPVARATRVRPQRGGGFPYAYALARDPSPYLYFRVPNEKEMLAAETQRYKTNAANWRAQAEQNGVLVRLAPSAEPPDFLANSATLQKPYGVERRLHVGAHSGQSGSDSGFALLQSFEWQQRVWGVTTELDVIALDRTHTVRPSEFHGLALGKDLDLPVGIAKFPWIHRYRRQEDGKFVADGSWPKRTVLALTGEPVLGEGTYWQTSDGFWVEQSTLRIVERRTQFPSIATGERKWIDISINDQVLVAYTGEKAEYVTLVSTGAGGMGDPEKTPATVRGTFMIFAKHVTETMDGEEDKSDSFNLRDVPFVQYFHKGYALHGTYWHDDFGRARSHGCVNLAPIDAAWLFEWTDPSVPADWHAVLNKERGTAVHIHP